MFRKYVKFCVLLLITAFIFTSVQAADEKILTIGVSGTYSGGFGAIGKHVGDGETDYLKQIAAEGGIKYKDPVSGQEEKAGLKIIIEDNQYHASKAVIAYEKLKAQGADVIIGFGSTPGEACSLFASRDKLPYLSWYSYASPSGYKPTPLYYWSFLPTIAESSTPMIKWFVTKKWQEEKKPKIGILAANVPSWKILGKPGLMDKYIQSIGGELAGIEFIPLVTTDMSNPVLNLVYQQKADCIILIGSLSQTVILAKDLKRLGITPDKLTVVCNLSAWDESLFKSIPEEVDGLYGEVHVVSADKDVPGMKQVKETAEKAGKNPEKIVFNYTNGFIGAKVLEAAIKRALEKYGYEKVSKSGEIIRNELNNFQSFDSGGLTPNIEVKHSDQPYFMNYARIVRAKDGKFEDAGEWISIDRIEGTL